MVGAADLSLLVSEPGSMTRQELEDLTKWDE